MFAAQRVSSPGRTRWLTAPKSPPRSRGSFFQVIRYRFAGWTSQSPVSARTFFTGCGTSRSGSRIMAKVGRVMPLSRQNRTVRSSTSAFTRRSSTGLPSGRVELVQRANGLLRDRDAPARGPGVLEPAAGGEHHGDGIAGQLRPHGEKAGEGRGARRLGEHAGRAGEGGLRGQDLLVRHPHHASAVLLQLPE